MIRPATEADRAAILALHIASWQDSYGIELPDAVLRDVLPGYLSSKWAPRRFRSPMTTLVAVQGGDLAGFICALADREVPLIDNLHVHPDLRGAGVGARLLTEMRAALAAQGFARAELTVLARNTGAHRFYLAQGGVDDGLETDTLIDRKVQVRRIGFDLRRDEDRPAARSVRSGRTDPG